MNDQELHTLLVSELGIGDLPEEAQDEIVSKLGEIILHSVTVAIFEKLSPEARTEFDAIGATGDQTRIAEFLAREVPDMPELMQEEVQKVLIAFREGDQLIGDNA